MMSLDLTFTIVSNIVNLLAGIAVILACVKYLFKK